MTLKDIDYILELAQTQNFNRAAENLYTAQPTLSYHIKAAEEELGFQIFTRSSKGALLTPAGAQFCTTLRNVRTELKNAIEQAQNFSTRYSENITVDSGWRSAIYDLPKIIKKLAQLHPSVSITPTFSADNSMDKFLKGETDIAFSLEENVRKIPDIKIHPFYKSPIYLLSLPDDPLVKKERVTAQDLAGRTLMVGGGSPAALKKVQQRIINTVDINYFNSADHDTTLTNVAANLGICLAPGFLNDHNPDYAWTPFDCEETISCVLCTHKDDTREIVQELVRLMQEQYR
ncbi:MAG: LysR family transcriptional regulator [Lachnospiraceae bacterium]|nr:LysR family transcriptional regulator [Lachnospiraceae bacterium]